MPPGYPQYPPVPNPPVPVPPGYPQYPPVPNPPAPPPRIDTAPIPNPGSRVTPPYPQDDTALEPVEIIPYTPPPILIPLPPPAP